MEEPHTNLLLFPNTESGSSEHSLWWPVSEAFESGHWNTHTSQSCVSTEHCSLQAVQVLLSWTSGNLLTRVCWSALWRIPEGHRLPTLLVSVQHSLCSVLQTVDACSPPRLPPPLVSAGLHLHRGLETSLGRELEWPYVTCFLSLRGYGPSLPIVQCLENCCFIQFWRLFQVGEGNSILAVVEVAHQGILKKWNIIYLMKFSL